MKRLTAAIALLALVGCSAATPDPLAGATTSPPATADATAAPTAPVQAKAEPPPEYPAFAEIDPYTSYYFITFEDTDLEGLDQEWLFSLGLTTCQHLDQASSIRAEIAALEGGSPKIAAGAGTIVAAAITDFCPHHRALIEDYLAGGTGQATTTAQVPAGSCDPNYGGCVPVAEDVDCAGGTGDGPAYVEGPVEVVGSDVYGLDPDGDGVGCN